MIHTTSSTCFIKFLVRSLMSCFTAATRSFNWPLSARNIYCRSSSSRKSLYISLTTCASSIDICYKSLLRLSSYRTVFKRDYMKVLSYEGIQYPFNSSLWCSSTITFFRMNGSNYFIDVLNSWVIYSKKSYTSWYIPCMPLSRSFNVVPSRQSNLELMVRHIDVYATTWSHWWSSEHSRHIKGLVRLQPNLVQTSWTLRS